MQISWPTGLTHEMLKEITKNRVRAQPAAYPASSTAGGAAARGTRLYTQQVTASMHAASAVPRCHTARGCTSDKCLACWENGSGCGSGSGTSSVGAGRLIRDGACPLPGTITHGAESLPQLPHLRAVQKL